ncbi:MAG TPA: VOC family protein [Acidobacteriaceae bacterium]|nr:VOC family protein [Acidobacteriaceae bacterium]
MSKFETNAITWFEIPVSDIDRARGFYENVLDSKLMPYPGEPCFIFPTKDNGVAGCIVQRSQSKPAADGTIVFLNADGQLNAAVDRAKSAGSKVLVPRTEIPGGFGFFACILDSEGNHVGLHSRGE